MIITFLIAKDHFRGLLVDVSSSSVPAIRDCFSQLAGAARTLRIWGASVSSRNRGARGDFSTIVALTATPPYDVSPFEWQPYEELCGPVDAEVSVPELVLEGDLCPHQDSRAERQARRSIAAAR